MENRALRRIAGLTLALAAAFAACDQRPTSPDRARADRQSLAASEDSGTVEFEDEVASADTTAGALTLADSTVVAVDSATEWDSAGDYTSLGEVVAALSDTTSDAPGAVLAEGEGSEQADGSVLAAEIEAEAEEEEPAEFEGSAASVDVDSGTVTLDDSTVIRVDSTTAWDTTGDYTSLDEVAAATSDSATDDTTSAGSETDISTSAGFASFAASHESDSTSIDSTTTVGVEGEGEEQADGSILASEIKAEAEAEEEDEPAEFEGEVSAVQPDSGTLTLDDSTVVRVDSTTEWDSAGDYTSLSEVAAALDDSAPGDTASDSESATAADDSTSTDSTTAVVVEGEGQEQADGSILASRVKAEADDADDGDGKPTAGEEVEFEGDVLSVHGESEHHQLNLEGGQRIAVDSATGWTGAYGSLDAVAAAVDSGRTVHAEGSGVEQHDGSVVADEIEAEPKTAEFEDEVASVNPKNGNHQVRLDGGTRLSVPEDASWSGDASSLEELDAAADTASSVSVEGEGTQGRNGVIAVAEIEVEVSDDADSQSQGGKGGRGGQGNSGGNNGNGNGQGQGNGNSGKGKGGGGGKGGG